MNNKDAFVKGEVLGKQFHYHVLDVAGPPMIHVTRSRLPEIVLFGRDRAADAAGCQRRQRDHGHQLWRRRNRGEQVFRAGRRPEADRLARRWTT